jgi:hypothetical protein
MKDEIFPLDRIEIRSISESHTSSVSELIALLDATRSEYINPERLTDYAEFTFRRIVMHAEFALSFFLNTQSFEECAVRLQAREQRFLDASDL